MKRSTRILFVLALIEALLAAIWFWLVSGIASGTMTVSGDPGAAVKTISSIMGGIMGLTAVAALLAAITMRRHGN